MNKLWAAATITRTQEQKKNVSVSSCVTLMVLWNLYSFIWRSIPAKIQCCILHSTFRILSFICYLTSEFTLSSFNFPRATFKFLPCTFIFSYAIFKFAFKFSGLHFQVFAFNVEHLPIKFLLSTFDFTYFTCKFALYIQLFKLYFSSADHPPRVIGGLNWRSPPPLTLRWKDFLQEWGRETFSSTIRTAFVALLVNQIGKCKEWQATLIPFLCENMYSTVYSFALTSRPLQDFPFLYEMIRGYLKIWQRRGWFWIKCHFESKACFKFGPGWPALCHKR